LVRYSMPVMPYVILAAAFTLVKSIPSDWRLAQQPDSTLSKGTEILSECSDVACPRQFGWMD
jgi:hypothetical protein